MPKQVLFIHGGGGGAFEADAKLASNLQRELSPTFEVRYPQMPDEEEVDYPTWKRIIQEQVHDMGEGAILVGHSIGASVLIKMLTDRDPPQSIAGAFLISSPFWHDHEFWRWDEVALSKDAGAAYPRDIALYLYHGDADEFVPVSHLDMLANLLPHAIVRRLPGRDHQINEDMADVALDIEALKRG